MISLVKTENVVSKRISRKSESRKFAAKEHIGVKSGHKRRSLRFKVPKLKLRALGRRDKKNSTKVEQGSLRIIRRAMRLWLLPYWKIMVGAILANIIVGLSTGALPLFIRYSIDILFDPESGVPLILISLAIFMILATRAGFTFLGNFLRSYVVQRMTSRVQYDLFKNLIYSDYHAVSSRHSGQILTSLMNEARQVDNAIGSTLINFMRNSITLVGIFASMFVINWQLASFVTMMAPLVFLSSQFFGRRTKGSFRNMMNNAGDWGAHVLEVARGMRIIKAYGGEVRELNTSQERMGRVIRNSMRTQRSQMASGPMAELLVGLGMAAIFFYVGYEGRAGNFSQGELVGFISAMLLVYQPLKAISMSNALIQQGIVATQSVFKRLDKVPKITSLINAPELKVEQNYSQNRICFNNVRFRYPKSKVSALKGIDLHIRPGEMVALVGRSGGGKSTILNLLQRFYDANQGQVQIDGQDIRGVQIASLRRSMALVLQDVFLFDDTIAANIAYADQGVSLEAVIRASKIANAHDFIMKLPDNYQTKIGENGATLSGGQRQRISIARAALRDAPILLLDEPTSALDSESERAIQEAMQKLLKNRTVLVIAHRLSTIMNADRIYVLHEGQIIEEGTHEDLIEKNGAYTRLYKIQFPDHQIEKNKNLKSMV